MRTRELVSKVRTKLWRNPLRLGQQMARDYHVSKNTMHRLLKEDLHVHPYKLRKVHMLSAQQKAARHKKCAALLQQFSEQDVCSIFFSD